MKKILPILLLFITQLCLSQSGIGTATPQQSAILDLSSPNKALLLSRVNNAGTLANPRNGMIVFDTSTSCIKMYQDGAWSDCIYILPGTITSIDCSGMPNYGKLKEGTASLAYTVVRYFGGNGKKHHGQSVSSTGITGLTATLGAGNFINGDGTLIFNITGIPSGPGEASFAINIGGKTCNLIRTILPAPKITTLNCGESTTTGTFRNGVPTSSASFTVTYSENNGGEYDAQTINSTGVIGLTATLSAGSLIYNGGILNYVITGTPSSAGTAAFAVNIGGKSCTVNVTVAP